jgi:hypothetical protein
MYFLSLLIVDLNMLHLLLLLLSFLCYMKQELNAVSSLPTIAAAVSNSAGYVLPFFADCGPQCFISYFYSFLFFVVLRRSGMPLLPWLLITMIQTFLLLLP